MTPLEKEQLEACSSLFNRSMRQTEFLFNLVDRRIDLLIYLELVIRVNHIWHCPDTKEEINFLIYGTQE